MDFLKKALSEDLYKQVEEAINTYNGEADDSDKIKLANLATGEYVSSGKYEGLTEQLKGKSTEIEEAQKLINELKKATKENEGIQKSISTYETQVEELQKQLHTTKLESALKVALLSENAKASDIDYLTFKLDQKLAEQETELELDENDNIKNWDDVAAGLKTQYPTFFTADNGDGGQKFIDPNKLPKNPETKTLTKEEILKKPYSERNELYNSNPEAYEAAMNEK